MAALTRGILRFARPLLGALALAASGCVNPFQPATPEPPDPSGIREDFSTPARLLATLVAAIENKGQAGRVAWADAMADSTGPSTRAFYAFHDPRVVSAWRLSSPVPPPEPWNLELERRFYDRFVSLNSYEYLMAFDEDDTSPNDVIDEGTGTALLHRKYYVAASVPNSPVIIAIGYVDLHLAKYDGRWFVVRWEDRLDPQIGVDPSDSDNRTLGWRRLESVSS